MSCDQQEGANDNYILEKPSLEEELTEEVVLNIEEKLFYLPVTL
jgi:hypothetical protein